MLAFLSPLLALLNPLLPALQGALPILGGFLAGLTGSIRQYWQYYLIGLLALLFAGSTYEWQHTSTALKTEKAAHAADNKAYHDAQAEAQKKADAEKAQIIKTAKDKAHAADKNYTSLYATYRANLLRYQASQGAGSRPNSGQLGNTAQDPAGPGSGSVVPTGPITISADDANICAMNTARLQAAHDWALTLKDKPNENP